jgi:hypothetical protein
MGKGNIESFDPVILTAHGGDLNGFIMVKGNREKMMDLRWNDESFMKLFMQTNLCLQGFGCVDAYVGEGTMELMKKWGEMIG